MAHFGNLLSGFKEGAVSGRVTVSQNVGLIKLTGSECRFIRRRILLRWILKFLFTEDIVGLVREFISFHSWRFSNRKFDSLRSRAKFSGHWSENPRFAVLHRGPGQTLKIARNVREGVRERQAKLARSNAEIGRNA